MLLLKTSLLEKEFSTPLWITLADFAHFRPGHIRFSVSAEAQARLHRTRAFIAYALEQKLQIYGLTTGFADLRSTVVPPHFAAELSRNMIQSHDAGIGPPIPLPITFGSMCLRAHSLSKGYSGFAVGSLETLVQMINEEIVPEIPSTGSLGASGDLAFLARLGRAMMGEPVWVSFRNQRMLASEALALAKIAPFQPGAKEGLALTNGTSFMASRMGFAYLREMRFLDNLMALEGLFLQTVGAVDAAFYEMLQTVRYQRGQCQVAEILRPFVSEPDGRSEVQNDYSIRCLPQILGPKIELILEQGEKVERELNAITDNPLIFRGDECSRDVHLLRKIPFDGDDWVVASGGNFHGETSGTVADVIAIANAKIALTLERQLTYLLNPARNHRRFPVYLVADARRAGLLSGFMITQYTANALAHKISLLAQPATTMNITSANESEDVVSYGATASEKLFNQQTLLQELLAIHLLVVAQAYSLQRTKVRHPLCESIFEVLSSSLQFPQMEDESFEEKYQVALSILESGVLGKLLDHPFAPK